MNDNETETVPSWWHVLDNNVSLVVINRGKLKELRLDSCRKLLLLLLVVVKCFRHVCLLVWIGFLWNSW